MVLRYFQLYATTDPTISDDFICHMIGQGATEELSLENAEKQVSEWVQKTRIIYTY